VALDTTDVYPLDLPESDCLGKTLKRADARVGKDAKDKFSAALRNAFTSDEMQPIFRHAFWLVYLLSFQKFDSRIFERIHGNLSSDFFKFLCFPGHCKDDVQKMLPLLLCEAVCACFKLVFPSSSGMFDSPFVIHAFQVVSAQLSGFPFHPITIREFRRKHFGEDMDDIGTECDEKKFELRPHPLDSNCLHASDMRSNSGLPPAQCSAPTCLSTTRLSPLLQKVAGAQSIFTAHDPGRKIRFADPTARSTASALESRIRSLTPSFSSPGVLQGAAEAIIDGDKARQTSDENQDDGQRIRKDRGRQPWKTHTDHQVLVGNVIRHEELVAEEVSRLTSHAPLGVASNRAPGTVRYVMFGELMQRRAAKQRSHYRPRRTPCESSAGDTSGPRVEATLDFRGPVNVPLCAACL